MSQSLGGPDPLAVDPRAVGGTEVGHAPAGREPFQHRVQVAGRGVVGERRCRSRPRCRSSSGRVSSSKRQLRTPDDHLDLRAHRAQSYETPGAEASSAMPTLIEERYEVLETLGAGGEARVVKALDRQHDRFVALKIRQVARRRRARGAARRGAGPAGGAAASGAAAGARGLLRRRRATSSRWTGSTGTDLATLLARPRPARARAVERARLPRRRRPRR